MVHLVEYSSPTAATAPVQVVQAQMSGSLADPLINQGSDTIIYAGLALLVLAIAFAIKSFDSKLERTLLAAFIFCVVLIVILWYL